MNLGDYKAGCAQRLFLKNRGQFRLCYDNLVLLSQFLVCLVFFGLSICYTEFCRVTCFVCVHASVRARERESETGSHHSFLNRGLCANTYGLHDGVCHATLFPFQA